MLLPSIAGRRLPAEDVFQDLPLDWGIVHAHHDSPFEFGSTGSARLADQ